MAMPMERPRGSMKLRALVSMKMFMAERDCSAFGSLPDSSTTISAAHHSPSMNSAAGVQPTIQPHDAIERWPVAECWPAVQHQIGQGNVCITCSDAWA